MRTQRHLLQTTRGVSYTCCLRAPCTAPSAADLAALIPTRTCTKHSCWRDTHVLTSTSCTPPQLATPLRRTCTHLWSCPPRSTLVFSCNHNTLHLLVHTKTTTREISHAPCCSPRPPVVHQRQYPSRTHSDTHPHSPLELSTSVNTRL